VGPFQEVADLTILKEHKLDGAGHRNEPEIGLADFSISQGSGVLSLEHHPFRVLHAPSRA
jgi:hypothetical protein